MVGRDPPLALIGDGGSDLVQRTLAVDSFSDAIKKLRYLEVLSVATDQELGAGKSTALNGAEQIDSRRELGSPEHVRPQLFFSHGGTRVQGGPMDGATLIAGRRRLAVRLDLASRAKDSGCNAYVNVGDGDATYDGIACHQVPIGKLNYGRSLQVGIRCQFLIHPRDSLTY
jgi:hypothetical protein